MEIDDEYSSHGGADRAALYPQLRRAVINELRAPDLLPFQDSLVDYYLTESKNIEDAMFDVASLEEKEIADLHLISAKRCKFYLQCYFRARIAKIDKYFLYLLSTDSMKERMSPAEQRYAERYRELVESHLRATVLNELPPNVQALDERSADANMVLEPNVNIHVFCRALSDVGTIVTDEDRGFVLHLMRGSISLLPYKRIQPYVLSGDLELV